MTSLNSASEFVSAMHLKLPTALSYDDASSTAQAMLAGKGKPVTVVDTCGKLDTLQCATSTSCRLDGVRGICTSQIDGNNSHYMSTRAVYHALYKNMPRPSVQDERPVAKSTKSGDITLVKKSRSKRKSSKKSKRSSRKK